VSQRLQVEDLFTQCCQFSSSHVCFPRSQRTWLLQRVKHLGWAVGDDPVRLGATSDRVQMLTYSAPLILRTVSQAPVGPLRPNFCESCSERTISLTVGPIIGSQLFEHATNGWTAIMGMTAGLIMLAAMVSFVGAGSEPLARRLWRVCRGITASNASATTEKQEQKNCENETRV
jgi:hypothetical protein